MVCAVFIEVNDERPYYAKFAWDLIGGDLPWFQSYVGEPLRRSVRTNATFVFFPN